MNTCCHRLCAELQNVIFFALIKCQNQRLPKEKYANCNKFSNQIIAKTSFLATLLCLHFSPVSQLVGQNFDTNIASRLASLFYQKACLPQPFKFLHQYFCYICIDPKIWFDGFKKLFWIFCKNLCQRRRNHQVCSVQCVLS